MDREYTEGARREGIKAYVIFMGLTEIIGPGVGCECPERNPLYGRSFSFPEIVDPVTL